MVTAMSESFSPIREILVPMDFSECSVSALNFAKRLASACDARLHLLYVDDDPILIQECTGQKFRDEHEDKMAMRFIEHLTAQERETFDVQLSVRLGTASHEIVNYAEERDIDMIVIGNVGRSMVSTVLLGSVTSHVIAGAKCPVTSVKVGQG